MFLHRYDRSIVEPKHWLSPGALGRRRKALGPIGRTADGQPGNRPSTGPSQRALGAAADLASLSQGEVWVLHLRNREMRGKTGAVISSESHSQAEAAVAAAAETLARAGIKAHGVVRDTLFGYAAQGIVTDAAEHGVDLIVMAPGDMAILLASCWAARRTRSST